VVQVHALVVTLVLVLGVVHALVLILVQVHALVVTLVLVLGVASRVRRGVTLDSTLPVASEIPDDPYVSTWVSQELSE
jgi:hypothetical protein